MFQKLIKSYALDAIDGDAAIPARAGAAECGDILSAMAQAQTFTLPAVGIGKDVRFNGGVVHGAALWVEERFVHVCAFRNAATSNAPGIKTNIARPSRRG
jgi:hypothetical protein